MGAFRQRASSLLRKASRDDARHRATTRVIAPTLYVIYANYMKINQRKWRAMIDAMFLHDWQM
jgi:hypothetical protein